MDETCIVIWYTDNPNMDDHAHLADYETCLAAARAAERDPTMSVFTLRNAWEPRRLAFVVCPRPLAQTIINEALEKGMIREMYHLVHFLYCHTCNLGHFHSLQLDGRYKCSNCHAHRKYRPGDEY